MLRYLIVDDEEMSRANLRILCQKIEGLEYVAACSTALEALRYLRTEEVDLLFLDIEMPGISGIDLIRSTSRLPKIILITAKPDYALEAFEFRDLIADYITKPVSLPRLLKAVDRIHAFSSLPPGDVSNSIFVKTEKRFVRIDLNKLLYIETVGDYVRFKTTADQYIVHSTLKSIDDRLRHPDFLKVHRSFIVNLSKVVDIEENSLVIDQKVIPISRSNKQALMQKINPI